MNFRKEVVDYAKRTYNDGLTVGTAGNLSLRDANIMYITPSALPYDQMEESDILEVDVETGEIIKGHRKPSSETSMHRYIYQKDPSVRAIVHTHSTYATIFGCAHMPIPPIHYLIADIGRQVSVAPYARYGSEELAHNVVDSLGTDRGILLANHGVVAVGETMADAYRRADVIEELAELAYGCHTLGSIKPLTNDQLDDALEGFKTYISE